jgi:hypothetical protein
MHNSEFCFSHNPETVVEKGLAVLEGGRAPKVRKEPVILEPIPLQTIEDITSLIQDTINRVRTEPMTHQKANSIGYLAGIALKGFELSRIEEQLRLIQSVLKTRKQ